MRVLLIGLGAFGVWFSRSLRELGHEVIAVERDEAVADRFGQHTSRTVVGDATDPAVLERAGARDVDAAVVSTSEELSATILATVALRDLGVEEIYAKVRSTNEARALDALNISETIFPEREAGFRLAHRIGSKAVLEYTPIAEGYSMQEVAIPDAWLGKTLLEIDPRTRFGVQIIGVRDALSGALRLPPEPDEPLKPSESLLVAGRDDVLAKKLEAPTRR